MGAAVMTELVCYGQRGVRRGVWYRVPPQAHIPHLHARLLARGYILREIPVLRLVCAWCRTEIRPGADPVSHGICEACKARVLRDCCPSCGANDDTGCYCRTEGSR